ncbi:MAG: biopolymer transporter ExbD [Planctomycetales bacterium]
MKVPSRERGHGLAFNITPLIDIVFLLIIFFLAASHFARSETAEAVELPQATQGIDDEEPNVRRLIVTVTADQRLLVQGRDAPLAEVERLLIAGRQEAPGPFEVRIRTDRTVPYHVIEPILLACARHGIADVKFAVVPEG